MIEIVVIYFIGIPDAKQGYPQTIYVRDGCTGSKIETQLRPNRRVINHHRLSHPGQDSVPVRGS